MPVKKKAVVKKPKRMKADNIKDFHDNIRKYGECEMDKDLFMQGMIANILIDIAKNRKLEVDPVEEVPLPPIQTEKKTSRKEISNKEWWDKFLEVPAPHYRSEFSKVKYILA